MKAENERKKTKSHDCDICGKGFPSGKSLGGHKRFHVMYDAAGKGKPQTERGLFSPFNGGGRRTRRIPKIQKTETEDEEQEDFTKMRCSSYGLRKNPKKTWRAAGDSDNFSLLSTLCVTDLRSSSDPCDIDTVEEFAALCLLMLSRDGAAKSMPLKEHSLFQNSGKGVLSDEASMESSCTNSFRESPITEEIVPRNSFMFDLNLPAPLDEF